MVGWGEASRDANDPQYAEQDIPLDRIVRAAMHGATVETRGDHTMKQEDTALQAAWEEWLAAHPDRSTAGPVYRPGFDAGWGARQQVIDSLTAERAQSASEHFRQTATTNAILVRLADMLARAEAAEAEVKRLREALAPFSRFNINGWSGTVWENAGPTASVLYRSEDGVHITLGDFARATAALATPPSEGGQS